MYPCSTPVILAKLYWKLYWKVNWNFNFSIELTPRTSERMRLCSAAAWLISISCATSHLAAQKRNSINALVQSPRRSLKKRCEIRASDGNGFLSPSATRGYIHIPNLPTIGSLEAKTTFSLPSQFRLLSRVPMGTVIGRWNFPRILPADYPKHISRFPRFHGPLSRTVCSTLFVFSCLLLGIGCQDIRMLSG